MARVRQGDGKPRVNGHMIRAFCDWVKARIKKGYFVLLGSPFEADAQLAKLEIDGFTDGTLSEDSDVFFYAGTQNIYSGFNTRGTNSYRTIINRATADPCFGELRVHSLFSVCPHKFHGKRLHRPPLWCRYVTVATILSVAIFVSR